MIGAVGVPGLPDLKCQILSDDIGEIKPVASSVACVPPEAICYMFALNLQIY